MKHLLSLLCSLPLGTLPLHAQETAAPATPPPAAPAAAVTPAAPPDGDAGSIPPAPATPPHPAAEAVPPAVADGTETYAIDAVHSNVGFKVKHLFSYVTGRFNTFDGTISGHPDKPEEGNVTVTIQVASIDTKDAKRDAHLRSEEFFDAEKFPTITFVSKKVHRTGQDSAFVLGDLTMRGVTKEAILQTKFLGKGKGMSGRLQTGWEAKTALKRSDFGLTWNKAIEGTQLVSDDIEIDLQIEAVQPEKATAPATPPPQPEKALPEQSGVVPPAPAPPAAPDNKPTPPPAPEAPTPVPAEIAKPLAAR